jgi:hypothetical protein
MIKSVVFCDLCGKYISNETEGVSFFKSHGIVNRRILEHTTEHDVCLCSECLKAINIDTDEDKAYTAELEADNAILKEGIKCVRELIDDSSGVAGLHLNGVVSSWESLEEGGENEEWLMSFNDAEEILK